MKLASDSPGKSPDPKLAVSQSQVNTSFHYTNTNQFGLFMPSVVDPHYVGAH